MDFNTFSRSAHETFDTVPEEFRDGVDGLTVRPEVLPHPILPGVFTLGQCITESYPSDWIGPETLRSVVALYHGSFHALASSDPRFDWEGEIWATLTHELRHHLESLAGDHGLEWVDYAMEEAFRRAEGEGFDPLTTDPGWSWLQGFSRLNTISFWSKSGNRRSSSRWNSSSSPGMGPGSECRAPMS